LADCFEGGSRVGGDVVRGSEAADCTVPDAVEHSVIDRVSGEGSLQGFGRGKNYERNRRNREAQRLRKKKRQAIGQDWRKPFVGGVERDVVRVGREGFFSGCSQETQEKLRESRARLLVAENERRVVEEEQKLKRMQSVEGVVHELIRVSAMAEKLRKQTSDSKIGGWAETVVEAMEKNVASLAPSSVPSLESVGYGKSALRSSDGVESEESLDRALRVAEYQAALKKVDDRFDAIEVHSDEEYDFAVNSVKAAYSDVAYSADELKVSEQVKTLTLAMHGHGVGHDDIMSILEVAGMRVIPYSG